MLLLMSQLQCNNRTWYTACICFRAVVSNVRYAGEQKQIYAVCGNFQLTVFGSDFVTTMMLLTLFTLLLTCLSDTYYVHYISKKSA